jgi:hypothetical protein
MRYMVWVPRHSGRVVVYDEIAHGVSNDYARKGAMHFRCIRTHENFPGRPGRLRFTVRCGLVIDPPEAELLEKYGAPLLEALFTEPNAMAHLRSPEGITRPFETVDAAHGFVEEVKQAIAATPAYWQRAEAFPGRE